MNKNPITGYAYTKEKGYGWIDPETDEIVYSREKPPGFERQIPEGVWPEGIKHLGGKLWEVPSAYGMGLAQAQTRGAISITPEYGSSKWAEQEKEYLWQSEYDRLRQEWSAADDRVIKSGLPDWRKQVIAAENFSEFKLNSQKVKSKVYDIERKLEQINNATNLDERTKSNARINLLTQSMPRIPQLTSAQKPGAPTAITTLEKDIDWMVGRLEDASSWRPGAYNLSGVEAISMLKKYIPEAGWFAKNTTQKIQIFSVLDRVLRKHKEIEWTDKESKQFAEELGLLPKLAEIPPMENMVRIQSPTGEIMDVSSDEWESKQKEAESEGWRVME